jgi:DNA-binding NarL/FixJ family response regulator
MLYPFVSLDSPVQFGASPRTATARLLVALDLVNDLVARSRTLENTDFAFIALQLRVVLLAELNSEIIDAGTAEISSKTTLPVVRRESLRSATNRSRIVSRLLKIRPDLHEVVGSEKGPTPGPKDLNPRISNVDIDWLNFEAQYQNLQQHFRASLLAKHPKLTKQEARICQLLRVGMKSYEIARLICISERGVENHRFNIRKKLGLKTEESLAEVLSKM